MESISTLRVVKIGVVALSYVALTLIFYLLSYQSVQFRIAEILMLLCLFSKDYVIATSIGCFIANVLGPLGAADVIVGTSATLIAGLCIYLLRNKLNLFTASLFPVVLKSVSVAFVLRYSAGKPLFMSMGLVALGEFVCISVIGVIILHVLKKKTAFMEFLKSDGTK